MKNTMETSCCYGCRGNSWTLGACVVC